MTAAPLNRLLLVAAFSAIAGTAIAVNPPIERASADCPACEGHAPHGDAVTASVNSVDLTFNLGGAAFERPNMFSAYFANAGTNADDPGLPQGMEGIRSYFDEAPQSSLWRATLRLNTATISADTFKPSSLTYNDAFKMEVLKSGDTVRQVLTHDFLVDVQPFATGEGFTAKWYAAADHGAKSGGFYQPVGAVIKTVTVSNPNPTGTYTSAEVAMTQAPSRSLHYKYVKSTVSGKSVLTLETRETAGGNPLATESLVYQSGAPEQNAQDCVRTVKVASYTSTTGLGTPVLVSRVRETYSDVGGKKRLTARRVLAGESSDDIGPLTTYGYYNTPGNTVLHGRPRYQINPDGSWIAWDINVGGTNPTVTEVTPFGDAAITIGTDGTPSYNANECRVVTSTITGPQEDSTLIVKGQALLTTSRTYLTGAAGERILKTLRGGVTTCVAHYPYGNGTAPEAGRLAWETREDGTATVYTYAGSGGFITVTATTGIADGTGDHSAPVVTNHNTTVTQYNPFFQAISEENYLNGTLLENWSCDPANCDIYGRPLSRIWKYGSVTGETESFAYNCCGLESHTARDGSVTTYTRDALKRVYRTTSKATAVSPVITTTTEFTGLTTTTSVGSDFVSATTRSLDGLTITTESPSRKSTAEADRLLTRTATDPSTRTTVESYKRKADADEDGWVETTTSSSYRDGRTSTASGTAVTDMAYVYGTETLNGAVCLIATATTTGDPAGLVTKTYTDALGRTVKSISPGSGATTYGYYTSADAAGSRGRLKTVTDADGVATTYAYPDLDTNTVTRKVPTPTGGFVYLSSNTINGISTPSVFSQSLGLSRYQRKTLGGTTVSTSYRSLNGLKSATTTLSGNSLAIATRPHATTGVSTVTTTHPDGTITRATTTPSGNGDNVLAERLTRATPPALPTVIAYTTSVSDARGRLLTVTDSRTGEAGITIYGFDADNDTKPDFTESGTPLSIKQGTRLTRHALDLLGRVTISTLPDTSQTHTSYDSAGRVAGQWGSLTYPTFRIYNDSGQLTELRTYQNLTAEPTVQIGIAIPASGGNPAVPATYAATFWIYDSSSGRLLEKLHPGETDDSATDPDYTYTPAGRIQNRNSERGINTHNTYAYGYLTGTEYSDDTPDVAYTYDSKGRVAVITQAGQSQLTYSYAADFGVDTETICYNLNSDAIFGNSGDFTRVLDRATRSYGRDTGWTLGTDHQADYTYDTPTGRLATVSNPSMGSFSYAFVSGGDLLASVTRENPGGTLLKTVRTYDSTRDTLATISNQMLVPNAEAESGFDTTTRSAYDYTVVNGGVNSLGQRKGVQATFSLGSGVAANTGGTSWGYDSLGQLTSADAHDLTGESPPPTDRSYTYDTIGNRIQSAEGTYVTNGGTTTLDGALVTGYFADAEGTTPGASDLNQYGKISFPAASCLPEHDKDGNLKQGPLPTSAGANRTLVWDAENRLIEVLDGPGASAASLVRYRYDALGRLIASSTGSGETLASTLYVCDGWNRIAEYSIEGAANPALAKTYLWGPDLSGSLQGAGGVGGLLATRHGAASYYPTFDGNGNISEYLTSAGAVAAHFEYDPFGNLVLSSGSNPNAFPFRFSTKPLDDVTGLYYYGYRWYNPLTGRWPSRDPIEEEGGLNLYWFVSNNGVVYTDYLGLIEVDDSGLVRPEKTEVKWDSTTMDIDVSARTVPYTAVISFECKDGKITGDIVGEAHIYLNWNQKFPIDRNGKRDTWERVMGHEQKHVKVMFDLIMALAVRLARLEPESPATDERAEELTERYQKIVDLATDLGGGHSDDKKNPRPADGQGYPPLPGSGPVPPRPENDPSPPPPLKPLPEFRPIPGPLAP